MKNSLNKNENSAHYNWKNLLCKIKNPLSKNGISAL
jgi:hypothetical protein